MIELAPATPAFLLVQPHHPSHAWDRYATEVLGHAGMSYSETTEDTFRLEQSGTVVVFARPPRLSRQALAELTTWLLRGGRALVCGGPGDLAPLAGVTPLEAVSEDHVTFVDDTSLAQQMAGPLHAFGGRRLRVDDQADALARWTNGDAAVSRSRIGTGEVIVIGVDLWQSIVRIQQGWPVLGPGTPASDGSAPVGVDGILRCDDGLALSYRLDRRMPDGSVPSGDHPLSYPPDGQVPIFDRPQADLWREVVVSCLLDLRAAAGEATAWIHHWPAGVPAIGHMSHDSDQNRDEHALRALELFGEAGVQVTWCHCWPGGYSDQVVDSIGEAGHEQALHFNALENSDGAPWSLESLRQQRDWARNTVGRDIVSNKNHYTRWEGWDEFYGWCTELGIRLDQSRGPSKPGSSGFPYGSSHVFFPVDREARTVPVLELPFQTQDVGWVTHEDVVTVIFDQVLRRGGVAHFLFHGVHMVKPRVAAAVLDIAEEGRRRGLLWWTASQIAEFELARRTVSMTIRPGLNGGWLVDIDSGVDIPGAGIVVAMPGVTPDDGLRVRFVDAQTGGDTLSYTSVERCGRLCAEIALDLTKGRTRLEIDSGTPERVS